MQYVSEDFKGLQSWDFNPLTKLDQKHFTQGKIIMRCDPIFPDPIFFFCCDLWYENSRIPKEISEIFENIFSVKRICDKE